MHTGTVEVERLDYGEGAAAPASLLWILLAAAVHEVVVVGHE